MIINKILAALVTAMLVFASISVNVSAKSEAASLESNVLAQPDVIDVTSVDLGAVFEEEDLFSSGKIDISESQLILGNQPSFSSYDPQGFDISGMDIDTLTEEMALPPLMMQSPNSGVGISNVMAMTAGLNDDPNYPIGLNLNAGYQQEITPSGASRWFLTQATTDEHPVSIDINTAV